MHSGVHPALHPNYHHQIAFRKFNLIIFYPPPSKRLIWYYQQANKDLIKQVIELSDLISNIHENKQVFVFNETNEHLSNFFSARNNHM